MALVGTCIIFMMLLMAVFAPWIAPYGPEEMLWGDEWNPPGGKFLLGTDKLGRDVLSRVVWASRTSLMVGLLTTFVVTIIGCALGVVAGFYGGKVENAIMRITDMFMMFPGLPLLIVIASTLQTRDVIMIITIMGLVYWPRMARISRSKVLSVKEELYIEAARGLGIKNFRIIFRHILPNSLSPILVYAFLFVTYAILIESALSFLGLGDPTTISWGFMLAEGRSYMRHAWWVATFPGLAIFATVMGFNLLSDGLRDMLDVRLR